MKPENIKNDNLETSDEYPMYPADPQVIPEPTIWPIGLAFGLLFVIWGLIASLGLTIAGVLVTGVSLAGWISDLKP